MDIYVLSAMTGPRKLDFCVSLYFLSNLFSIVALKLHTPLYLYISRLFSCLLLRFESYISDTLDKIKFYLGVRSELPILYHYI